MELHRRDSPTEMAHALDGRVVEVPVADDVASRRQRRALYHGDLVVVRADVDAFRVDFDYRVVAAVMADRQPPGLGARRQCQELVPETDAEDRCAARVPRGAMSYGLRVATEAT